MKTIFNTYIEIESQEQADRLKKVCIDNELDCWPSEDTFVLDENYKHFGCYKGYFDIWNLSIGYTQVTETEWMQLLKEYKS